MFDLSFFDKLSEGFYFGSGGIGDMIMLLSSMFDKIGTKNIVFWANDANTIKSFIEPFKYPTKLWGIKNAIIFNGYPNGYLDMYKGMIAHKNFKGKAHFPDDFKFRDEWYNNAEHYKNLCHFPIKHLLQEDVTPKAIGCMLYGSDVDKWKIKALTQQEFSDVLKRLVTLYGTKKPIYIFGAESEKQKQIIPSSLHNVVDYRGIPFKQVLDKTHECEYFYCTDTWLKTWAMAIGRKSTVFKNTYTQSLFSVFGPGIMTDPGDKIFIDWKEYITPTTIKEFLTLQDDEVFSL